MKKILFLVSVFILIAPLNGQNSIQYILKARALYQTGKADQAIIVLSDRIKEKRENKLYLERGEAYLQAGNYSGSISDFNEASSIIQYSGEYGLARVYALKGDPATSLYHLGLNLSSSFKKSEKEIFLDPAFGAIENTAEWRKFWKTERFTDAEKNLSELEFYLNAGKTEESGAIMKALKQNEPGEEKTRYAEALYDLAEGKYGDAVKLANSLLASDNANSKYLKLLARAQFISSNHSGASNTYSLLLNSDDADASYYLQRAECYRKTGETEKALSDINNYLDLYPGNKNALSMAGKVEAASGDNLKALEYFSQNLKLHPNDADCYIDRANSYLVSKSWELAEKDYSMSLDLKPENSDAWLNKGVSLIGAGKQEDACHDFRQSLYLGNKRASEFISRYCIR
jgi:tetratricopeptide (TPR) repeat protein